MLRAAMMILAGLVVVTGTTGCDTSGFCGGNQIISFVFCRDDPDSTPATNLPPPPAPPTPQASPSADIAVSDFFPTIVETVNLDGSWSDSDGHVTKFEWDLDDDEEYEIEGVPTAGNHDVRTVAFTEFGDHTVRLRVTDDDGLVTVWEEEITLVRRHPVAELDIFPANPVVGQEVTFDASRSSAADSTLTHFRWDLDGNNPNGFEALTSGPITYRTYFEPGTFQVGMRAFDDEGDRGERNVTITVAPAGSSPTGPGPTPPPGETSYTPPTLPTAALSVNPNPASPGQQVTFDGSGSTASGGIASYEWDLDGVGGFESNTGTVATTTQSYAMPTVITVRLRVTSTGGFTAQTSTSLSVIGGLLFLSREHAAHAETPARAFSAHVAARPVRGHTGRFERRGAIQSVRGMLVTGRFNGRLPRVSRGARAEALLAKLLRAGYRARLDASVNTRTKSSRTTMLALATLPQSGRPALACVRITIMDPPGKKRSGSFVVLGGTGDAARLAATGTFTFKPGRGPSTLSGRVKARLVAPRGLPPACTALR